MENLLPLSIFVPICTGLVKSLLQPNSKPNNKKNDAVDNHAGASSTKKVQLYDPNVPTQSHAEFSRTLLEKARTATLCTLSTRRDREGYPYGSLVIFAVYKNDPIFLLSQLAAHTKNLNASDRASLMVAEDPSVAEDPLELGRVTLVGPCRPVAEDEKEAVRAAFLERNPSAEAYVDYADFGFFRLKVESIRYIGGFGSMSWVQIPNWYAAEPDPIVPFARGIIDHMNADHADIMVLYCQMLTKATDTSKATMTAVDRYGFELSAVTENGPQPIRLGFSKAISNATEARKEMVKWRNRFAS